jgi:16S rRNA (cytosine967-C5)-methyltransferase
MRRLLEPFDERVHFRVQDAATTRLSPEYDLILCDVPCTGTGTIARNPEIRFRVDENGIARQHERQVRILSSVLGGLLPDGRLLYSTCSLEFEENEAVVEEVLAKKPGFHLISIQDDLNNLARSGFIHTDGLGRLQESAIRGGFLRTLPGTLQCDGFFAALMVRG